MPDTPEPPLEVQRDRRFVRRELWFVLAVVVIAAVVAVFALNRPTRQPVGGAPLGSMNPQPAPTSPDRNR